MQFLRSTVLPAPGSGPDYFAALCEVDLGNNAVIEGQLKDVEKARRYGILVACQARAGFRLSQ